MKGTRLMAATAGLGLLAVTLPLHATLLPAASAAGLGQEYADALDQTTGGVTGLELTGDQRAVVVLDKPFHGFPTAGSTALVLSTGDASVVADRNAAKTSTKTQHGDDAGTVLNTKTKSVDGNDLTQVAVTLNPPKGSACVGFDFMFLTEEFPRYKGQKFNDVFTAELGSSKLSLKGTDVEAPNNFAFSSDKEVLSLNAFSKFVKAGESSLNGRSEIYGATSPLDPKGGATTLYLTLQDLGDSYLDSAVVVDNLRYLPSGTTGCAAGTEVLTDTDGDGLPDKWETEGIDLDKDGTPELDLPAMGADPKRKDIFVEIDWMNDDPACTTSRFVCAVAQFKNKTPSPEALAKVVKAFADAPVSNPDGTTGINLHLDYGPDSPLVKGGTWGALARGNKVPFQQSIGSTNGPWNYDWKEFDALRAKHSDPVRDAVFRYAVYGHAYPTGDPTLVESSGLAQIPGTKLLVTSHDWVGNRWTLNGEAGTFMHELGHNLGIRHGGADETNNKEGYYSLMNYDFQFHGVDLKGKLDYSTGRDNYKVSFKDLYSHSSKGNKVPPLDTYSDWDNITFTGHGRIGSMGSSAPSDDDAQEPHAEESTLTDAVLTEGAGGISLLGPTLTAQGVEGQVLLADITNASDVDTEFRVDLEGSSWLKKPLAATVPAGKTQRVSIPVVVDTTTAGAEPVKVTLSHGKQLVATSMLEVNAVDLTDPATEAKVRETMEELLETPLPGLEADVLKALDETVANAVDVDLSGAKSVPRQDAAPERDGGFSLPLWAWGLIALAVLAIGGFAVSAVRKKS